MNNKKQTIVDNKDNIPYKGSVTVKIVRGGKIRKAQKNHNNASKLFFKHILNCIGGVDDTPFMPNYIQLYDEKDSSILNLYVPKTRANLSYDNNYSMIFTFIIPYTQLIGKDIQKIKTVKLFSTSTDVEEQALAVSVLSKPLLVEKNSNILVLWEITLADNTKTTDKK